VVAILDVNRLIVADSNDPKNDIVALLAALCERNVGVADHGGNGLTVVNR